MIYCREKLLDILLEYPWIDIEERIDVDVCVTQCIKQGLFTTSQWRDVEEYIYRYGGMNNDHVDRLTLTDEIDSVLRLLAERLNYTDELMVKMLPDTSDVTMAKLKALKGN
jgi:hypothetical protein